MNFSPFVWLWVIGAGLSVVGAYWSLRQPLYAMGVLVFGLGCGVEAYVEQNQLRGSPFEIIAIACLVVGGGMQLWHTVRGTPER